MVGRIALVVVLVNVLFVMLQGKVVVVVVTALSKVPVPPTDVATSVASFAFLLGLKTRLTSTLAVLASTYFEYCLSLTS